MNVEMVLYQIQRVLAALWMPMTTDQPAGRRPVVALIWAGLKQGPLRYVTVATIIRETGPP